MQYATIWKRSDMVNFAYSTNCYQHYADMMIFSKLRHKRTQSHTLLLCLRKAVGKSSVICTPMKKFWTSGKPI